MTASRIRALSYLAYRALLAHPWKRLRQRGSGQERFLAAYAGEGLAPTPVEDWRIAEAAAACVSCGLCELGCGLAGAVPAIRGLGLHAAFRLYSKSAEEMRHAGEALAACAACTGCDPLCPTGVPISRIVTHLAARAAGSRPSARGAG